MKTIIFIYSVFLIISCKKENNGLITSDGLTGKWQHSFTGQPQGIYLYEFTFNNDSTFSEKISGFGIYNGQSTNDLAFWHKNMGNYSVRSDKIIMISHKYTWWDSFYVGSQPATVIKDGILYNNCSFKIKGDVLELNYISYPADAPVNTTRQYKRVKGTQL